MYEAVIQIEALIESWVRVSPLVLWREMNLAEENTLKVAKGRTIKLSNRIVDGLDENR